MNESAPPLLHRLAEVVEAIRHATSGSDHEHALQLRESLCELLEGDVPDLPKTRALSECRFTPTTIEDDDLAAADSLDEIRGAVTGLGPTPGWH